MIENGFIKDGKLFIPDSTLTCATCAFAHAQCWTICCAFAVKGGMREVPQEQKLPEMPRAVAAVS